MNNKDYNLNNYILMLDNFYFNYLGYIKMIEKFFDVMVKNNNFEY